MRYPILLATCGLLILLSVELAAQVRRPGLTVQFLPVQFPRLKVADLQFVGGFRLPAKTFGVSDMNYAQGPLAYDSKRGSVFIVGHTHHQAIAEFKVPQLVASSNVAALKMAAAPVQDFVRVLGRSGGGNPQKLDRIGGLVVVQTAKGSQLVINAYEYYDAPGDNTQTTLLLRDASDLAKSKVDGFYSFAGGAGHASGWLSQIPAEWQLFLGGGWLTGQSSGIPIIGRTSVGPSAFVFDMQRLLTGTSKSVPTIRLLDFSLRTPLHADLSNKSRKNDLWTHLSRAVHGFIAPGTRTYVTFGHSGGHQSGVCYKCKQNNGNVCGGYCPPDAKDRSAFYWLWDVNDLLAVRHGRKAAHQVRPYSYGPLPTPFPATELGGASFDSASGLLFVTLQRADRLQGRYANPPIVAVYRISGRRVLHPRGRGR